MRPELVAELAESGLPGASPGSDVADRAALAALLDKIAADGPPRDRREWHTAGVLDDGVHGCSLPRNGWPRCCAPKADGATALHELTAHLPLEAFVLFATLGGVVGGAGQANYAAANAHLDGARRARRAAGLHRHRRGVGRLGGRRHGRRGTRCAGAGPRRTAADGPGAGAGGARPGDRGRRPGRGARRRRLGPAARPPCTPYGPAR
ncbi:KR domain-containing protein [Streptomyces tricolor]|nr:KR domain-containing protein [Streptomyces tricolor]